jgi:hypothetical protein
LRHVQRKDTEARHRYPPKSLSVGNLKSRRSQFTAQDLRRQFMILNLLLSWQATILLRDRLNKHQAAFGSQRSSDARQHRRGFSKIVVAKAISTASTLRAGSMGSSGLPSRIPHSSIHQRRAWSEVLLTPSRLIRRFKPVPAGITTRLPRTEYAHATRCLAKRFYRASNLAAKLFQPTIRYEKECYEGYEWRK